MSASSKYDKYGRRFYSSHKLEILEKQRYEDSTSETQVRLRVRQARPVQER